MSPVQHTHRTNASRYEYKKALPGREEKIRVERVGNNYHVSVDCEILSAQGSSRKEVMAKLIEILSHERLINPFQTFLDIQGAMTEDSTPFEVDDTSGRRLQIRFVTAGDVIGQTVTTWRGYVEAKNLRLHSKAFTIKESAIALFSRAASAVHDTAYINALARGLLQLSDHFDPRAQSRH